MGIILCAAVLTVVQVQIHRQVLCTLPGSLIGAMQCGAQGRHVVCAVHSKSGSWAAYADGRLVGNYDGKDPVIDIPESPRTGLNVSFSPDGRRYAFVGHRGGNSVPVIDAVEDPAGLRVGFFVWSKTSQRIAYTVGDYDRSRLIVDGKSVTEAGNFSQITFSPDGRRLAWVAGTNSGIELHLDGRRLTPRGGDDPKAFQQIHTLQFSPDSKRFAYVQGADPIVRIILDDKVVGTFDEIAGGIVQGIEFSPDNKRLLVEYGGLLSTRVGFIEGGKVVPSGTSDGTMGYPRIIWSPNGNHYCTVLWRANKMYAVEDGNATPEHVYVVADPGWLLDDGRLAYAASDDRDGRAWTTHVGTTEIAGWLLRDITPDGRHMALCGGSSNGVATPVQVDGRQYGPVGGNLNGMAMSRPSARHFWFRTIQSATAGKLYVDGALQPFDGEVSFSPDECHIAIIGRDRATVDGIPVFEAPCESPHLFWDSSTTFHGYAVVGNELIRVDGKTG